MFGSLRVAECTQAILQLPVDLHGGSRTEALRQTFTLPCPALNPHPAETPVSEGSERIGSMSRVFATRLSKDVMTSPRGCPPPRGGAPCRGHLHCAHRAGNPVQGYLESASSEGTILCRARCPELEKTSF